MGSTQCTTVKICMMWCFVAGMTWLRHVVHSTAKVDGCLQPRLRSIAEGTHRLQMHFPPGTLFVTQHCSALVYPGLEVRIGKCSLWHSKVIPGCTGLLRQFSVPEYARAVLPHLQVKFHDTFVPSEPHPQTIHIYNTHCTIHTCALSAQMLD